MSPRSALKNPKKDRLLLFLYMLYFTSEEEVKEWLASRVEEEKRKKEREREDLEFLDRSKVNY